MAISNGYSTLAEFKVYAEITSTDATDDGLIEDLIEAASRMIDQITGRTFYARTETHKFDVPLTNTLWVDDDLLTITTFTNGDSTEITSSDYIFLHPNKTPYYAVKLKSTSTVSWQYDTDGGTEQVLSIAGTWGYSSTTPDNIKYACLDIAKQAYKRRTGQGQQAATVTAAGVVLTPADIPGSILRDLNTYKRRS